MLAFVIAFAVVVISILIIYGRWNYGTLEKLGIPVVKPHFLFGSTWCTRFKSPGYRDVEWMKEHGPIFGVYEGRYPNIFVCDPEILRLIMVKDVKHFDGKTKTDFGDPLLDEMPDYLEYDKWKIVRNFTSPAFTGAKLRIMNYPMKQSLIEFINQVEELITKDGSGMLRKCAFDELLFDSMTDLTLRCLFSIKDETGRFPKLLKELSNPDGMKYSNIKAVAMSFPFLFNLIPPTLLMPRPAYEFIKIMENLIASRKTPNSPPDVVDICIEQIKKLESPEYKNAKMTRETILFQSFNFFFSGQDENSLVISAMIYHILTSPNKEEIQDKLYNEIDSIWEQSKENETNDDGTPTREQLLQAEYLQALIYESLRLYPFYSAERECTKDWYCEKYNFTIKEGITIIAPLWAVNRNPDYFVNPEEFNPDRFIGKNKEKLDPYAWSSFGHGPRHCTGKPLSLEVLRFACAYIFKHFQFHLRPDSELNFHPDNPWVFINHAPIYFDVSLRN